MPISKRTDYWQHKISLFLHDPIHKAFKISGHESRAAEIIVLLNQTVADKEHYKTADMIASGLTRAALPSYSSDPNKSGAIDITQSPILCHPLVSSKLRIEIPNEITIDKVHADVINLLKDDIGINKDYEELVSTEKEKRPLSGFFNYSNNTEDWAKALYFYLFFAFKKRLRNKKIGGIGALWDVLPADTRMPDHAIWHHCGLTSALGSALVDNKDKNVSLVVFSITPVQTFISKARKLRDMWTASVLLSYLSFIGIREVLKELGPDHIMYPSLHDQSLVEEWISREYKLENFLPETDDNLKKLIEVSKSIASFPNKFVFLCASSQVETACAMIKTAIQDEWLRVAGNVRDFLREKSGADEIFSNLFDYQISDYWQYSWASSKLASLSDSNTLEQLIQKTKWKDEEETIRNFASEYGKQTARLYGATHSLVQTLLAATKFIPSRIRKPQYGKKCPLCGEHEVLHDFLQTGQTSAKQYNNAVKKFWDTLRMKINTQDSTVQIGENESICAVCAIKRFLPLVYKNKKNELLCSVFNNSEKFPSTTELAAKNYIKKLTGKVSISRNDYPLLLDALHNSELEGGDDARSKAIKDLIEQGKQKGIKFTDRDKYYAVLLMDGDKMGDLINGKTIDARWSDVIHPELNYRFKNNQFNPNSPIRKHLNDKRILSPSLHAAISDALNSFARFSVAPIVQNSGGKLIYAGGDDVCAVLPLDTALNVAESISLAYNMEFVKYGEEGAEAINIADNTSAKIGIHLGKADGISISGAIIIAHHKEPLREVL